MIDVATAYNKYKFIGNDYLTWIWFLIETDENLSLLLNKKADISLEIGNSIMLENKLGDKSKENITIKGDQAGLEEGTTALRKGAHVTQINLLCKINEDEYKFTIKGESFNITGLKTPKIDLSKNEDEIEGLVIEKAFLCFTLFDVLDSLYFTYIERRISSDWKETYLPQITKWVRSV